MNDIPEAIVRTECCEAVQPSILKRLAERKLSLEKQMAEVDEALKFCEEHPEVEKAITAFSRVLGGPRLY